MPLGSSVVEKGRLVAIVVLKVRGLDLDSDR